MIIFESLIFILTFCLEDGDVIAFDFRAETITFTLVLMKIEV